MTQVQWYVRDNKNVYNETDIRDLILNWDYHEPGIVGVKYIKVSNGERQIEFALFNLEKYQEWNKRLGLPTFIVKDKFDLTLFDLKVDKDFESNIWKLLRTYRITRQMHDIKRAFSLEDVNCVMMEVEELMEG